MNNQSETIIVETIMSKVERDEKKRLKRMEKFMRRAGCLLKADPSKLGRKFGLGHSAADIECFCDDCVMMARHDGAHDLRIPVWDFVSDIVYEIQAEEARGISFDEAVARVRNGLHWKNMAAEVYDPENLHLVPCEGEHQRAAYNLAREAISGGPCQGLLDEIGINR